MASPSPDMLRVLDQRTQSYRILRYSPALGVVIVAYGLDGQVVQGKGERLRDAIKDILPKLHAGTTTSS